MDKRQKSRQRNGYFFGMSWMMLVTAIIAFGWSVGSGSHVSFEPMPTYLIVHGIVLTAWFVWFAFQTTLVRTGRRSLHPQTGKIGVFIAVAVIAASPMVTLNFPARLKGMGLDWNSDMSEFPALGIEGMSMLDFVTMLIGGNFAALVLFALYFAGAIYWRKRADIHKRLMLLASLMLFPPALARISRWPGLGGEDSPFVPAVFLSLLATLILYDLVRNRRVHRTTVVGLIMFAAINVLVIGLAQSEAGVSFARSLA